MTFDGDDYSAASSTTFTANGSPAYQSSVALVGTNALFCDASSEHVYVTDAANFDYAEGAAAVAFRFTTSWDAADVFLGWRDSAAINHHLYVGITGTDGSGGINVNIRQVGGTQEDVGTGDLGLGLDTWYFVVVRWNLATTTIAIEVYDSTGSQIGSTTTDSTISTGSWPASSADTILVGDATGGNPDVYLDQLFVADTFAEPLEDNLLITAYSEYGGGGSVIPITIQRLSRAYGPQRSQQLGGLLQ